MTESKQGDSSSSKLKASAPAWNPVGASASSSASAWGKSSKAVKEASPIKDGSVNRSKAQIVQKKSSGQGYGGNHYGGRHGHGRGGRGGRGNRRYHKNNDVNPYDDSDQPDTFYKVELWKPGEGSSDAAKQINRITGAELLKIRMTCMDPPSDWLPVSEGKNPAWLWVDAMRKEEIKTKTQGPRIGGDIKVSRKRSQPKETAPPLEECAPIVRNEETRWKAGVMGAAKSDDSDEVILKRALVCLNKLTLTKFEVVSDSFIEAGIGKNEKCLTEAISLIVSKAQGEPHFAAMYANLCLKLAVTPMKATGDEVKSKKGKKFKKMLLARCQAEFEKDTSASIAEACKGVEDEAEKEYHAGIIKKNYLGHMTLIGELYKCDLISIKIMLLCLPELLSGGKDDTNSIDEEKIECFTKLMTTIGERLEHQSEYLKSAGKPDSFTALGECWKKVEGIAGSKEGFPKVSTRLRFMLQDLIELKNKGWTARRQIETAKTLSQIHKEAAREESKMRRSNSSNSLRRSSSSGSLHKSGKKYNRQKQEPIQVDADGFTVVPKKKVNTFRSKFDASDSNESKKTDAPETSVGTFTALGEIDEKPELSIPDKVPTEKEIEKSMENILKEFFVGGDEDDAILSIKELIGEGDGAVERTTAVLSGGCLSIMEMKQAEVDKFIKIVKRCLSEEVIAKERVLAGLQRPLDVVSDIAIDAPLATSHLAQVIAVCMKEVPLSFEFLLTAPEWFLTEGNAAKFSTKVLIILGDDYLRAEGNIAVVEKLMTARDKENYATVADLMASC